MNKANMWKSLTPQQCKTSLKRERKRHTINVSVITSTAYGSTKGTQFDQFNEENKLQVK